MKKSLFSKSIIRYTLVTGSLIIGIGSGIGAVMAATADNMPQPHSDGLGATITDTAITAKVKTKLMGEDGLKQSDISVTTTNGVVTLDGTASGSKAKSLAEETTLSVEGVKSVDNSLRTPKSNKTVTKTKRVVSDSWITTKVKSEILADSLTKGFDVKVTTSHGLVMLKGELSNQDAVNHVKDIAAKVEGVKSVDVTALVVTSK